MPSDEERSRLDAQRSELREYLRGDAEEPLLLDRIGCCPVEAVICATVWNRLGVAYRFLMLWFSQLAPLCLLKEFFFRRAGVKVGRNVCISPDVVVDPLFPWLVELGDGCILGMGCRLITHEFTADGFRVGRVRIGRGAVVGGWSTVRSGVTVGARATIGMQSFVNRDVPDGATVAGVPARPIVRGGEAE